MLRVCYRPVSASTSETVKQGAGMGLIVNGKEPVEWFRDRGPWRVTYTFGRTTSGRLGIARIEVAPWRPGVVIPDAEGITWAVIKNLLNVIAVRRYIWTVNREESAIAKSKKRASTQATAQHKTTATTRRDRELLARSRELIKAGVGTTRNKSRTSGGRTAIQFASGCCVRGIDRGPDPPGYCHAYCHDLPAAEGHKWPPLATS